MLVGLSAAQTRSGAPLTIRGTVSTRDAADDDIGFIGLGTTNTSTPPAVYTDFAHVDALGIGGPMQATFWDTASEGYQDASVAGVRTAFTDGYNVAKSLNLSASYAAGKYLWLVVFGAGAAPSGTDPVGALSAPYLIL